jgi:hypothetical protein
MASAATAFKCKASVLLSLSLRTLPTAGITLIASIVAKSIVFCDTYTVCIPLAGETASGFA